MGLDDRAQHVPDATDERGEAVKTLGVLVVGQVSRICPVGQVKITKSLGAMLDHHVAAVVGQRAIDVIDAKDRVQESDRISDAILGIESVNVRLERLSELIDLLYDVGMIVRKFLEHADHVVLIGIHEALGVHPGLAHRQQVRWVGRCAGVTEIVTVDDGFDQRRRFNSVTLWYVSTKVLIVLVEDDDVSLVLSFGKQHVVPLFGCLAGIIQSFLALQQRALQD